MLTDVVIANKSYTKLTVPAGSQTDQIALRVIRRDCPDFLLPIKVMEIDGELEIRYELLEGVRLSYFPKKMKKREFIDLFVRLLSPLKSAPTGSSTTIISFWMKIISWWGKMGEA